MGRGREERLLKSLLLTLINSSSESSFLPPSVVHFCLCVPPLSFALSLVLTVYGQNRIRVVIVLCGISDRAQRLLETMLLNDNPVSQRWAQSHPSNLQLNSAQFTLRHSQNLLCDTHAHRQSNRIPLHTSPAEVNC